MRVKMIGLAAGPQGVWRPSDVVDVSETIAAALIKGGYAEKVPDAATVTDEMPDDDDDDYEVAASTDPAPEKAVFKRKR